MAKEFEMKTIEKVGVVSDNGKSTIELRITEVNGSEKYDIRGWYEKDGEEKCNKGIRLSKEELLELKKLLKNIK